MTKYTATWQDKETAIIYKDNQPFGQIVFDKSSWLMYGSATLAIADQIFRAELVKGNNVAIKEGETEIFTAVFHPLWGNLELQQAGLDTGYDIKGKWFKPGTRLTDADDNDLIVVTDDAWTGRKMGITVIDAEISNLMIIVTLYHHIRASAAAMLVAVIA